MDDVKRRNPKYAVVGQMKLTEVTMSDTLYTWCPPGLYRAAFDSAEVEVLKSRKRGTQYLRLVVRFRLDDGPWGLRDGTAHCTGSAHATRLVPLWHELDEATDGSALLSPNWFVSPSIHQAKGGTFDAKVRAWAGTVRWVRVEKPPCRPARVTGLAYCKDPDPTWLAWSDGVRGRRESDEAPGEGLS